MTAVVVIGAGMGGLAGAIRLAKAGFDVRVLEARSSAGGLASGVEYDGFAFDAGPYILLDRPGLEWTFERLGLRLTEVTSLRHIDDIYEVQSSDDVPVRFHSDLKKTASQFEARWQGSGARYETFVRSMDRASRDLRPMLLSSSPGPMQLIRTGRWRHASLLMKSLGAVLAGSGLPSAVVDAIAIWTHVAGQVKNEAPSPMAFVPALMHNEGAYYPKGGMRQMPRALERAATHSGVQFHYGVNVRSIRVEQGRVCGVETVAGDFVPATIVLSNSAALNTYAKLLKTPAPAAADLRRQPLQSPGVCTYLAVRGRSSPPYLRFKLNNGRCRLLIQPAIVDAVPNNDQWLPVRLMAPMDYGEAQRMGSAGQLDYLDRLIQEEWWRKDFSDVRVLAKRTPTQWGQDFNLYENSMNPVMTARFMRRGRVAHRSPYVRGLYLAGSSTHPGQWVSFCMISGVLAADCIIEDHR